MKKLFVNLMAGILIMAGFASVSPEQIIETEQEMVVKPILIEEVDEGNYFAFTSDDEGLYFTQDDVLTDGSKYEAGDVAYAYYEKDPEGRENTFIAVMNY